MEVPIQLIWTVVVALILGGVSVGKALSDISTLKASLSRIENLILERGFDFSHRN